MKSYFGKNALNKLVKLVKDEEYGVLSYICAFGYTSNGVHIKVVKKDGQPDFPKGYCGFLYTLLPSDDLLIIDCNL